MHKKTNRPLVLGGLVVFTCCGVFPGCGHRPNLPPMAEVSGTVTLDGQPLRLGVVQLVPNESMNTKGPPGVGYIDAEGNYEVMTSGIAGAVVGHHRIKVHAQEGTPPRSLVPRVYNDEKTSGLTAEIMADERNVVQLELTSNR